VPPQENYWFIDILQNDMVSWVFFFAQAFEKITYSDHSSLPSTSMCPTASVQYSFPQLRCERTPETVVVS